MRFSAHKLCLSTIFAAMLAGSVHVPADAQTRNPRAAASAPAKTAFDPNRIVTKVSQADLVAIVREGGHTVVSEKEFGDVSVLARTPNGVLFLLIGRVCDLPDYGPGCLGLEYQVRYDADSRVTLDNINTANQSYSATKVYQGPNEEVKDTVYVTHYVILDGGQRMENLATILINVLDIAPKASQVIWP